jgi:hypothetical protein
MDLHQHRPQKGRGPSGRNAGAAKTRRGKR